MRRLISLALLLGSLLTGTILASPLTHAQGACGQTVSGLVKNLPANSFTITDLDENHDKACTPSPSLALFVGVTQNAQYYTDFDLSNMDGNTDPSFDAWYSFRRADADNKYSVHFLASTVEFRVRLAGKDTVLGSTNFTTPIGTFAHLRVIQDGFTFTLVDRSDGYIILQVTDPNQTFASGPSTAFYADGYTNVCWDNVSAQPGLPA